MHAEPWKDNADDDSEAWKYRPAEKRCAPCSSLDEWLERDRKDTLGEGAPSGMMRLTDAAREMARLRAQWRQWEAAGTLRRRGKRYACKSCGEMFPTVRLNQSYCPACPAQVRKERERKTSQLKREQKEANKVKRAAQRS